MIPASDRDPGPAWRTPWLALGVSLVVAAMLVAAAKRRWLESLGDTDDAMRLVMVRQLLNGEVGWFDNQVKGGAGLEMHWSRLVDAGLAGLARLFGLFMPAAEAETAMRVAWPLIWVLPAVWAVLAITRRLGGGGAALLTAVMLIINILLYVQWWPGRIDHHDIQIALTLVALSGAIGAGVAGGVTAGIATGLGLAVGVEAMPFLALIGAGIALRFAADPQAGAGPARAYAGSLLAATSLFYVIQTPPGRLAAPTCDVLGVNLWAAVALASAGLLAAVQATARRGPVARLAALAATGAIAAGVYVAIEPACLGGPLAAADPREIDVWMRYIIELQPLLFQYPKVQSELVTSALVLMGLGAAAWLWLGRERAGRTFAWMLLGACFALGAAASFEARRIASYPSWFSLPLIAAAIWDLAARAWRRPLIPAVLATILFSPAAVIWITTFVWALAEPAQSADVNAKPAARCAQRAAFRQLASLPPGSVLTEIDLGPYVLGWTEHRIFAAPYHRMKASILAADAALSAPPGPDERAVRALGATYVANCPARARQYNHLERDPQSLQKRLDRLETPAWLEPLSPPGALLQVYRVRPANR